MKRERISILMLLATAIAGAVYFVIGEVMYQVMAERFPAWLVIPAYFWGLAAFALIGIGAASLFLHKSGSGFGDIVIRTLLLFLAIAVSAGVFEALYEQNIKKKSNEPTSYLFVIDNSGSMSSNDPQFQRMEAIEEVLEGQSEQFPFGICLFSNGMKFIREMAPVSDGLEIENVEPAGGTEILTTLTDLYNRISDGSLDLGDNGKILLLTDGHATDLGMFFGKSKISRLMNQYAKKNISISTVGLGNVDDTLMKMIAEKTGGVYLDVEDASLLHAAMKEAMTSVSERNLLGYREKVSFDFLYALLRFAAVIVIGVLMAVMKTYICEPFLDTRPVLKSALAGSFLAALCVEGGMNGLGLSPWIMRLLMCIFLTAATLGEDVCSDCGLGGKYETL